MVEGFEQPCIVNDIDNQYEYKLSQDTTPISQSLRVPSTTAIMTPITYTNSSVDSNFDNTIYPITSSIGDIGDGNGSRIFQRQMEIMNNIQVMIHQPGLLTPLPSGTLSDVSDGTQQQQQHHPTLIPTSTIPAANNARYNSTPSHQQPIIPANYYGLSRYGTTYGPSSNNNFGQDPRKPSTIATAANYNESRIIENQNDADTSCSPWLNNSSSSSVHSECINAAIYPVTSSHHCPDHRYYHSHHHYTTTTAGSSNDSLPSTTTSEYLPSPPSFNTNEKHLSHFPIYQDGECFPNSSSSSDNHHILETSPPSKRARPSPLLMPRHIPPALFDSDSQHYLLMHYDYMEREEAQPRFPNEGIGGSLEICDDLVPPLQMHRDQQNDQFQQQQQQRCPRKYHSRQASSSSSSPSWQPQQQRSRNKKHGHPVANSGKKNSSVVRNNTSTTTNRTSLTEASQSASSSPSQQQQQSPSISSPSNKAYSTSPEHNADDRPHQCIQCNRGFNRQQDLKRHLNSVHEKQFIHNCSVCHRSFSRRDSLLRHQKKCRTDVSFSTSLNADNNSVSSDCTSNNNDYNNSISSNDLHHKHHNLQNTIQQHDNSGRLSSTVTPLMSGQQERHHSLLYN